MKHLQLLLVILVALTFSASFLTGCEKSYKDKKPQVVEKKEQNAVDAKKKADEAKKKASEKTVKTAPAVNPDCFGHDDPAAAALTIEANGKKYQVVNGYRLKALNADAAKPLVLGVLTDIKNNIPKNLSNINSFIDTFKKEGVDAILLTGDVSEKYAALKSVLETIAKHGLLTFVIIGNREIKDDYVKAVTEVQAQYKNLVNLNRVRLADLGAVTLVSLPGYYDANYIHHPPACNYGEAQVAETQKLVAEVKNSALLVSHGPPRGAGKDAIDNAVEAGNVGDPRITKLIADANIPFGIFGNIHEAGGKAVGPDHKTVLEAGKPYNNLFLNPGPCDSDPWNMNDGSISRGMAGIMKIQGKQASYKILRAK